MHNGDRKALTSCLYPIKYLNESLLRDFLSHDAILLMSTSLVFTYSFFVFMKSAFNDVIFSETNTFLLHFYTMKRKKSQNFFFDFLASR